MKVWLEDWRVGSGEHRREGWEVVGNRRTRRDRMQCRMQEHKRVGGDIVGNGGAQHGREGGDTADDSTLEGEWKEGWDVKGVGRTGRDWRW